MYHFAAYQRSTVPHTASVQTPSHLITSFALCLACLAACTDSSPIPEPDDAQAASEEKTDKTDADPPEPQDDPDEDEDNDSQDDGADPVEDGAESALDAGMNMNDGMDEPDPSPPVSSVDYDDIHNCDRMEPPDPRDAQLTGKPDALPFEDGIDLVMPGHVLDWMTERRWQASHDGWHNIRRCPEPGAMMGGPLPEFPIQLTEPEAVMRVCEQEALIPAQRECENTRDGYEFLVMHRHMILSLRQAFPEHAELFESFPSFPFNIEDVPEEWRDRWTMGGLFRGEFGEAGWDAQTLEVANRLESIGGTNDGGFATEGELGMFIQCGIQNPIPGEMATGAGSIHGALHFKWVVQDSPHSLGKQTANLENYMFWKLHGWIDDIWERYREVKGLVGNPEDPIEEEMRAQCWEMHELGHVVDTSCQDREVTLPEESGVFHDTVRPILERNCASCHSECSPSGNVSLGGEISSADIVANLVDRNSFSGGQFQLVVPGEPMKSWLYLKTAGLAHEAGCEGRCLVQTMPPFGNSVTLTEDELSTISDWISQGAEAPGMAPAPETEESTP